MLNSKLNTLRKRLKPTNMHIPVLLEEVITYLAVKPNQWYIDATFGQGGHSQKILDLGGKVIGLDVDEEAVTLAEQNFHSAIAQGKLILVRANFSSLFQEVKKVKQAHGIDHIAGILFDFGTNSDQLTSKTRGFSFDSEAELDMRLDNRLGVKAKDLLAVLSERQLTDLFQHQGGEEYARKIAHTIVETRRQRPIETTTHLADLIARIKRHRHSHLHPATKVFQALRIAINDEMTVIETALPQALDLLESKGRLVTIAFHEGEDRLVKTAFRSWEQTSQGLALTHKPIQASAEEININPRARSAKLRVFEKQ